MEPGLDNPVAGLAHANRVSPDLLSFHSLLQKINTENNYLTGNYMIKKKKKGFTQNEAC